MFCPVMIDLTGQRHRQIAVIQKTGKLHTIPPWFIWLI
jgi:hypothetical protein